MNRANAPQHIDPDYGRPHGTDLLTPDSGWHDKLPGGTPVRFWMEQINRRVRDYAATDAPPEMIIGQHLN